MAIEVAEDGGGFYYGGEIHGRIQCNSGMCTSQGGDEQFFFFYDSPITLFTADSQSAIYLANNPMYHKRTKHIDIKYHWIIEKVGGKDGVVCLFRVSSGVRVADVLTKTLTTYAFEKHSISIKGNVYYDISDL